MACAGRLARDSVCDVPEPRSFDRLGSALVAGALAILPIAYTVGRGSVPPPTASAAGFALPPPRDVPEAVAQVSLVTVMIEGGGVYGSGILVDPPRGRILTSWHVVSDMKSPRVTAHDGSAGRAKVLTFDRALDLALLEAPALARPDVAPPRFGDPHRLRPGEEVYAIGSPRKLAFTVSRGIVSYVDREMEGARYVQLDMAINDGNSGGPVFNARGEVLGVMSFILKRSQGLAFALPIDEAARAFNLGTAP